MAHRSLGPFPKTLHLRQITTHEDQLIDVSRKRLEQDLADEEAFWGMKFLTWLIFSTRSPNSILSSSADDLVASLRAPGYHHFSVDVSEEIIREVVGSYQSFSLFEEDPLAAWKQFDGPAFCDFARMYFARYLHQLLCEGLGHDQEGLATFAYEAALITRTFSARWYNACAKFSMPDVGTTRWYFRHCLGKLGLELERETSGWEEPAGNPWSRKKQEAELSFFESLNEQRDSRPTAR